MSVVLSGKMAFIVAHPGADEPSLLRLVSWQSSKRLLLGSWPHTFTATAAATLMTYGRMLLWTETRAALNGAPCCHALMLLPVNC